MIDQDLIERGRRLNRLMENEDFYVLLQEIKERIAVFDVRVRQSRRGSTPTEAILSSLDRWQELTDVLDWMEAEIERGGKELIKKNAELEAMK